MTVLTGHTLRVLYLSLSPDGSTIVTGAGDETIRFWNVFPEKKEALVQDSLIPLCFNDRKSGCILR